MVDQVGVPYPKIPEVRETFYDGIPLEVLSRICAFSSFNCYKKRVLKLVDEVCAGQTITVGESHGIASSHLDRHTRSST
jgi:hypothetical protein